MCYGYVLRYEVFNLRIPHQNLIMIWASRSGSLLGYWFEAVVAPLSASQSFSANCMFVKDDSVR